MLLPDIQGHRHVSHAVHHHRLHQPPALSSKQGMGEKRPKIEKGVEEQQGDSFRESRMEVQTQRTVDNSGITINKRHHLPPAWGRGEQGAGTTGQLGGVRGEQEDSHTLNMV